MIDPPKCERPGSDLEMFLKMIFLNIQHVHGQMMIDLPSMTDQDLTLNFFKDDFFKDSTCAWSKDD